MEVFNCLLNAGFNPTATDKNGKTILDYGSMSPSSAIIKTVLKMKYPNNDCPSSLWSPLHWACRRGDFEIVRQLSDAGLKMSCVVTLEPPATWTPLDVALYCGNRNLISKYGSVTNGHAWLEVVPCRIVREDLESRTTIPILKSHLAPSKKSFDGSCDECFLVSYISVDQAHLY